jgi:hypothetical protein
MIIKETEAIEYNCHYPDALHCVGCRCMAWRWAMEKVLRTNDDPEIIAREYYTHQPSTTHGYCGLAGRP